MVEVRSLGGAQGNSERVARDSSALLHIALLTVLQRLADDGRQPLANRTEDAHARSFRLPAFSIKADRASIPIASLSALPVPLPAVLRTVHEFGGHLVHVPALLACRVLHDGVVKHYARVVLVGRLASHGPLAGEKGTARVGQGRVQGVLVLAR